jgi:nucleoid-associated protein YgaU
MMGMMQCLVANMNSPCKSRIFAGWALLWILSVFSPAVLYAQDALELSIPDEAPLILEPGAVGSRPIQMFNSGDTPVSVRLRLDLPAGWSMLIPPPSVVVASGERMTQLLTFTVPSDAATGRYEILLSTDVDDANPLVVPVDVPARPRMVAEWMDQPELVRAGSRIEATLRLTNSGNATTVWEVEARSSLSLPVRVDPASLELDAGQSGSVRVSVVTNDEITNRLTHVASVSISARGSNAAPQRVTLATDLYPSRVASRQRSEGSLPATLTTTAMTEDGTRAGQVELRIPESQVKGHIVEALVRVPDARQRSTFSRPDQYSLRVATPDWSVRMGDHNWDATDLLEVGSLGFGVGGDYRVSRIRGGGFVQRSRRVFPEQQQAFAFLSATVRDNLTVGLNALAKRSYEEGESASLDVAWEPGNQFIRAEVAQGWYGLEQGRAAHLNMILQHGRSLMTLQAETADDGFLGAIRGARGGSISTRVDVLDGVRWTSQARLRERRYDLGVNGRATQTFGTGRTALTLLRSRDRYRASWTVTAQHQLNNNTLTDLKREETALESRVTLNRRRVGVNALVRRGQSKDPVNAGQDPYLATQVSLFGSRRSLSFNTSMSWLDGPTFYNPVDQERVIVGINLGWDNGGGYRVALSGLHSEDRLRSEQSFSMADASVEREFASGHQLSLRARTVRTAYDTSIRNGSMSVSWTVPLSIPVPGIGSDRAELVGRVVDAETGAPVADARVSIGPRSASTDADGRFSIRIDSPDKAYLTIDRASIGFGRRPVPSMPMAIEPALVPAEGLVIEVVRSAELSVQIEVDAAAGLARQSALNTALDAADKAGVLVEVRSPFDRLRRITDRDGQAHFTDLVPGPWEVFVVGASLPPQTVSRPDTVQVQLEPGVTAETLMTLAPERREVRLVGSGGISLSGAVTTVESVSLSREPASTTSDDSVNDTDRDDSAESVDESRSGEVERTHEVAEGESLARLARRYYRGSTLHWIRLWQANLDDLDEPDIVLPGQVLVIPPDGPLTRAEKQALLERAKGS